MKKADNFDPSKWLVENKITFQSRLDEDKTMMISPSLISQYGDMKSLFGDKAGDVELINKVKRIVAVFFPRNLDVSFKELVDKYGEEAANGAVTILFKAYLEGNLDSYQRHIFRLHDERKDYFEQ